MRSSLFVSPGMASYTVPLPSGPTMADPDAAVRELITNPRNIFVLSVASKPEERAEIRRAGQFVFFRNQPFVLEQVAEIAQPPNSIALRYRGLTQAIDSPIYKDGNRLVTRGLLAQLILKHHNPHAVFAQFRRGSRSRHHWRAQA